MKKHKMLITLASLAVAVAATATVAAYTLAGDGSSPPANETVGTQEPAFQDDKLPTFDPGPGQVSDDGGSVSVTNPKTGGGAIGIPAPGSQGTASDDPPAGKVVPDEGGAVHPLPVGSLPVANPDVESGDVELVPVPTPVVPIGKFDGDVGPTRNPKDVPKEDVEHPGGEVVPVSPGTGDLIDLLLATGADVNVTAEVVKQPFFSVAGTIILVDGERVQVMEYRDPAALEAEAAHISPDGSSIGTTMVSWVAPPHFFRTETTIVLYVGENPKVIEALTSVLGPQFAGR